jgi:DNA polymerase III subunit delta'
MARRARSEEIVETDRIEGRAHPRETFRLVGQDAALARAARAIRSGRPPQAWLINGPPGIGKATLAYCIARYLLRYGATDQGPDDLAVAETDSVAIQVKAASHPGLLVLKRGLHPETGKLMTVLPVDEIRRLANFFGLTSGAGGWRVAIVDPADDMNDNAANALLKLLEEPPPRAMLLLISHAAGRLLPTIRSRCQRLNLRPLDQGELEIELRKFLPEETPDELRALSKLAGGSIGAALRLAGSDGLMLAEQAERLIENADSPDFAAALSLAEKVAKIDDGIDIFGGFLAQALADRIVARAGKGGVRLDRWVELREKLNTSFGRTSALHLEPRQTILSTVNALSQTSRRGAL